MPDMEADDMDDTPGHEEAEEALKACVSAHLIDAIQFDEEDRLTARVTALEYLRGVMRDTPAEAGWSGITSTDVSDVVGWMMPGLMRIFAGQAGVVSYEGRGPQEAEQAAQASDYITTVFEADCDGYRVLWEAFYDALAVENGIIKWWWDDAVDGKTETLERLSEDQVALLTQDDKVKILGYGQDNEGFYTLKVQHTQTQGRMRVVAVPPEEFLINRRARSLEAATFIAHRTIKTRSDLVAMGFDRAEVDELPIAYSVEHDETDIARGTSSRMDGVTAPDPALDEIETFECYLQYDIDGDGITELVRVFAAGSATAPKILEFDEWPDNEAPFADLVAEVVPHTWRGRTIMDDVKPLQRIKTVLLRQTLDNLYLSNRPMREVVASEIISPDEMQNARIGGLVRVKSPGAIRDLTVPFTAAASLEAMRYVDSIIQARTGTSQGGMALDGEALVPQTATAKQIEHDASFAKIELVARNFAEMGLKRLFRGLLRLVVRHQDRPRTLRIRNKWVEFDPRAWNADMDVRINVGLGTGTRERDLAMLTRVGMEQDKVISQMGPDNPIVTPQMWVQTRHRIVTAAGLRDPDLYFKELSDEEFAQYMQAKAQSAPPNPKMMEAQGKLQIEQQKTQADIQNATLKAQADIEIAREKSQGMLALKREELQAQAQLRLVQAATGPDLPSETNIPAAR